MTRSRALAIPFLLSTLAGCGFNPVNWVSGVFGGGAPAGVVTGIVMYGGEPAAGRHVTLAGANGVRTVTDANGRYTFKGVTGGKVQVQYVEETDRQTTMYPNEVQQWNSSVLDMASGGHEVPPFDVAYNGLLYPDRGVALVVSASALVPFHWSVHPDGQRYRVHLFSEDNSFSWASDWDSQPTTVFGKTVTPGRYYWKVEIDGGDTGSGTSRQREVDF